MSCMQRELNQPKASQSIEEVVGGSIAAMRGMRDLTQRDFAAKLTEAGMPVDASAVSRIEKGTRSVRLAEAVVIASVLDVDLGFLMRGILTPEQELKEARRFIDISRQAAVEPVLDFIRSLVEARRLLEANPALLATLGENPEDVPTSPSDYIPWVAARIEKLAITDYVEAAPDEASQALELVLRWLMLHIHVPTPDNEARPFSTDEKAKMLEESVTGALRRSEYDRRSKAARVRREADAHTKKGSNGIDSEEA